MIYSFGVTPELTKVVKALIVIVICLFQSQEFTGRLSRIFKGRKKEGAAV